MRKPLAQSSSDAHVGSKVPYLRYFRAIKRLDDLEQAKERKVKAFFVLREEIKANAYDLSKVILQKLRSLEDDIRQDLDALEGMLG